ncbi:MAG: hypothetical protein FJ267_09685 [Planctomycetes bacterium]|nr:hypothetical protein [Planctomycetota bacterium]
MNFGVTAFFYGLIGLCVAITVLMYGSVGSSEMSQTTKSSGKVSKRHDRASRWPFIRMFTLVDDRMENKPDDRWFRIVTSAFFWPLYLPLLMSGSRTSDGSLAIDSNSRDKGSRHSQPDQMTRLIDQVESELFSALDSLNGWGEEVLATEQGRFSELQLAWRQQADRIRELDHLLSLSDSSDHSSDIPVWFKKGTDPVMERTQGAVRATEPDPFLDHQQLASSTNSRALNLRKLEQVRSQLYDDLMATLAWVRELVTMIHLARFTGAPASRATELVRQIASVVERLSGQTSRIHE